MTDVQKLEREIATRIRLRGGELEGLCPVPPALDELLSATGPAISSASAARPRSRRLLAAFGYIGAIGVALIIAIVVISLRPGSNNPATLTTPGPTVHLVPLALDASGRHVVVVGASVSHADHGAIAISEDGGLTWQSHELDTPPLSGVAARGSTVLATVDSNLYRSSRTLIWLSKDGGSSFGDAGISFPLVLPTLRDEERGILMTPPHPGDTATMWVTHNAGRTWAATTPSCVSAVNGISYPSPDQGWMACTGDSRQSSPTARTVWETGDTGDVMAESGAPRTIGSLPSVGELEGISMRADGSGWLWASDGFFVTGDSGATWTKVPASVAGSPSARMIAAVAGGPASGWGITDDGSFIETSDDGATWTRVETFPG